MEANVSLTKLDFAISCLKPLGMIMHIILALHKKLGFPLMIWALLLKKSLMENFSFCALSRHFKENISLRQQEKFAKSRAMRVCVPKWSTCQRGLRANVLACQPGLRGNVPACQKRANVVFSRANVPINVSTCYTAWQCFKLACRRASFSTWRTNVPKACHFSNIPLTQW